MNYKNSLNTQAHLFDGLWFLFCEEKNHRQSAVVRENESLSHTEWNSKLHNICGQIKENRVQCRK